MERHQLYAITAVQIVAVTALLWLLIARTGPWTVQRYLGTLLVLLGITLIAVARFQLGTSFSIKPEARGLVTHALYSRIRNPIYLFGIMVFAGMVVVVILQTIRAHREARVLEAAFGEAYREYRRKTWF